MVAFIVVFLTACAPSASPGPRVPLVSERCATPEQRVEVPDPALFAAVARATERYDATELTCTDLGRVTRLSVGNVADLEGLQYAVRLRDLTLFPGAVRSLGPLRNLPYVRALRLDDQEINNLADLMTLPELVTLHASRNHISDLRPLGRMEQLVWLELSDNEIVDVSPLARLTNLTRLTLADNQIEDASALAGLPLETLELQNNRIRDIAFVTEHRYRSVDLSWNLAADPAPLLDEFELASLRARVDLRWNCFGLSADWDALDALAARDDVELVVRPQRAPWEGCEEETARDY